MSLGNSNRSLSSRATLPTLTKITFRPYCYSFTATIRDDCDGRGVSLAQLARLIASTGHVGKIDDFTIKPIEQHSYLLSGFSQHVSSRPRSVEQLYRLLRRQAVTTSMRRVPGALASRRSEPSSGDNDGGLSDSDPDLSSDDDGCSSEGGLGRSGMGGSRLAALAGMEEGGQALEVDLQEVPSTHALGMLNRRK